MKKSESTQTKKVLVFRLSSLGDVILSLSFVDQFKEQNPDVELDFVTSESLRSLFLNHPYVKKTYYYDKKDSTLKSWLDFLSSLPLSQYDLIIDLHDTLRTKVARIRYFLLPWKTLKKERWKRAFFFLFKKKTPHFLRPNSYRMRVLEFAKKYSFSPCSGSSENYPNLNYLVNESVQKDQKTFCIMPSSLWEGKMVSRKALISALIHQPYHYRVLGTFKDKESLLFFQELSSLHPSVTSSVGDYSFSQVAGWLKNSDGLITNDTGLSHLAESLQIPVFTFFGPTHPDLGFGPFLPKSKTWASSLWCSPCSKDGSLCFRKGIHKYQCLKEVPISEMKELGNWMESL